MGKRLGQLCMIECLREPSALPKITVTLINLLASGTLSSWARRNHIGESRWALESGQ